MPARTPFHELPPAQQAGIPCTQEDFQRFCAKRRMVDLEWATESFAAEFVRLECGVNSRSDLNTSDRAAERFQKLRTEFDAWRGKIGAQR